MISLCRISARTYLFCLSAQWIGPQLETLELARKQVEIELNSTTDNPLIDVKGGRFHHGGAFQAKSIAQAMDATRLMIEHLGKLSFAQVTELNKYVKRPVLHTLSLVS